MGEGGEQVVVSAVTGAERRADVIRVLREAGAWDVLVTPALSPPGGS